MKPALCACGCGGELKIARYPSHQTIWLRGHNRPSHAAPAIERRFWSRVRKTPDCWLWNGESSANFGYGRLNVKGRRTRAHRFAWELLIGPIPTGKFVLHGCDNPLCVRPDPKHLHLGDQAQNMAEMHARRRDRHSIAKGAAA